MSDNTFKGPTFRYGPDGEARVFHDSRHVPEGWLDDPKKHRPKLPHSGMPPVDVEELVEDLSAPSRAAVIGELKERGIAFRVTAKTDVLYALLMSHVERENETE